MPQQINLCTPLQRARPQRLSARSLVAMAAGFLVVCLALGAVWTRHLAQSTDNYRQAMQTQAAEAATLKAALAEARGASPDAQATARQTLVQRQATLRLREAELTALRQGLQAPGAAHSDRLLWVARSLPREVWLTQLQIDADRFQASGLTLEPEALNAWVRQLASHPLTAGLRLSTVKLAHTRVDSVGQALVASAGNGAADAAAGRAAWSFELVSLGGGATTAPATPRGAP